MKTKAILCIIIILLTFQFSNAESYNYFNIAPKFSYSLGHTTYELNTLVAVDNGVPVYANSELEFPLNVFWAGGRVGWYNLNNGRKEWTAEISFMTNVADPGGKMKDWDWFSSPGYADLEFGYTESDAQLKGFKINAELTKRFHSWNFSSAYFVLGFKYQKVEQDIIGFEGWQLNDNLEQVFFSSDLPALYYRVTYAQPMAGLRYSHEFNRNASIDLTAAFVYTIADDLDDHLLRYKVSESDGTGGGFLGGFVYHRNFGRMGNKSHTFFEISADVMTLKVTTDQFQEWYGDDPITPEDDTGTRLEDIPHEFRSFQLNLGFSLGITF